MAGKFGEEFNLAVWQIMNATPTYIPPIFCQLSALGGGSCSDPAVCKELPNYLEVSKLNSTVFQ